MRARFPMMLFNRRYGRKHGMMAAVIVHVICSLAWMAHGAVLAEEGRPAPLRESRQAESVVHSDTSARGPAESPTPEISSSNRELDGIFHVLYVNSYHPGYAWSDQIYSGIKGVLAESFGENVDLRVEYLDGKRYSAALGGTLGDKIVSTWAEKYSNARIDLILLSDQDAYNLVRRVRSSIFPGVPLVFSGVEDSGALDPLTTGVFGSTDIRANLEAILRVLPDVERIWVTTDNSATGQINHGRITELAKEFDARLRLEFFDKGGGIEPDDILLLVKKLGPRDAVFFLDYYSSPSGAVDPAGFIPKLTAASPVPVFSHVESYISCGVTGGVMNSGELQGRQMAEIGVVVLKGAAIDKIPPQRLAALPMFDYRSLRKYGISVRRLPENSRILNSPEDVWNNYGGYVLVGIAFILLEGSLILLLVLLLRRQRHLRKQADAAAERFSDLFEMAPIPMAYASHEGRILDLNGRFNAVIGYSLEEIPTVDEWFVRAYPDPEYRRAAADSWSKRLDGEGAMLPREFLVACRDGSVRPFGISAAHLGDGLLVCLVDMTERRRGERAQRESEETFRALAENSQDVIMRFDADGRHLYVNPSVERQTGLSPSVFIGKTHEELGFPPNLCALWGDALRQVFAMKSPRRIEFQLPNGVWIDWLVMPEFDSSGVVKAAIASARDITERKRFEESLTIFQQTLENATDAIGMSTPKGRHYYQNRAFGELFGDAGEHPPDTLYVDKAIGDEVFAAIMGGAEWAGEVKMYSKDKRVLDILLRAYSNKDAEGNVTALVGIHTDITVHKRSEEALRASEAQYRTLFEAANDAIFIMEGECFVECNRRTLEIYGVTRERIVGRTPWRFSPPQQRDGSDSREKALERIGLALEGKPQSFEWLHNRYDGTLFDAEVSLQRFVIEGRVHLLAIVRDITERKRAEEALRASEETFRNVVNSSPMGIHLYRLEEDDRLVFVGANIAADRLLGVDNTRYIGMSIEEAFPDLKDTEVPERYRRAARSGEKWHTEQIIYDDCEISGAFEVHAFQMSPGNVAVMFSDITARKRAEEALRQSEDRFRSIVEQSPFSIIVFSPSGDVVHVNEAHLRLWGVTREMIAHFNVLEDPQLESLGLMPFFRRAFAGEQLTIPPMEYDLEAALGTGNKRIVQGQLYPIRDAKGDVVSLIVVHQDVSERERNEREKLQLQEQLQQAMKMEAVGRLAGGVAHDFNNMLGVIIGHAELASDKIDAEHPIYADIEEIRKAAERSADLTRQLLAFARKQTVSPRVLDLNETVEGMLKMLRRLIGEDIDLAWLPGKNLWPIKIDPSQIDQILANLCVNARDAIGDNGKVTIETDAVTIDETYCAEYAGSVPGQYVLLAVSDDGCGMEKETLDKLFEPFFTTKAMGKGTGLGLATVYGIVKQNDGFINVYSEPGRGTSFKIYLPGHDANVAQAQRQMRKESAERGRETVLLVEDEPAILQMTAKMLQNLGYAVIPASTPGQAISLATTHAGKIDLLMTDVVMPEMNGRDLAKNLLALRPDIKRLYMSGYTANVVAHHGILDEGVHFIQKPFTRANLAAKVREALDRG